MIFEMRTYLLKPGTVPKAEEAFAERVAAAGGELLDVPQGLGLRLVVEFDEAGFGELPGRRAEVDDARVVAGLGRQHERRHDVRR